MTTQTVTEPFLRESTQASIIDQAGLNGNKLTIWHRPAQYDLMTALTHIPNSALPDGQWTGSLTDFSRILDAHLLSLPHQQRDAMAVIADDAHELAVWFDSRCQANQYHFRFHHLNETMCPRFHTDRGPMRLMCTYRGSGTEWVPDTAVDYKKLKTNGAKNSDIVSDSTLIQTIPNFSAAILCGCDENGVGGVVHRSPMVHKGISRFVFCMTLDLQEHK